MAVDSNNYGICELCGQNASLVRSHIIPRAFFELGNSNKTKMVSNSAGEYPKRAPIGVYDRIVCDSCEARFGSYDEYAIKVLKQNLDTYERVKFNGKVVALIAKKIDYRLLKLFSIAVLWRASIARHSFFSRIDLGPLEERAKSLLLAEQPGGENEFASWWSFFDLPQAPAIMDPFRERWSGVNAYRFYFGRVLGYFKVDKQPVPKDFAEIAISPNRNLVLVARNFEQSADFRAMKTLLRTATGLKGFTGS